MTEKHAGPPAKSSADVMADEVDILMPERELIIKGEKITVHEFTLKESLDLGPSVRPIVKGFKALVDKDGGLDIDDLNEVFEQHADEFYTLLSVACGKPRGWLEQLPDSDSYKLILVFWTVNSGFFVRRLMVKATSQLNPARAVSESESSLQH